MKRLQGILVLIGLGFALAISGNVLAVTGGPDDFGYTYADSEETTVTYEWVDISAMTPTTLTMGDDDESTAIAIGFPFTFYGVPYDYLYIHANGFVKFDAAVYDYYMGDQCPLPSHDDVDGMIAFYYRDFNPAETASGDIRYATDTTSTPARFIVEFDNILACCAPWTEPGQADGPNPVSVQLVLYDNSEIQVNVRDPGPHQGADTTIGLEAPDAISGLNYRGCLLRESVLADTAIRFYPPTSGTPVVPKTVKHWGLPGEALTYDFTIFNLGTSTVTFAIDESTSAWSPTLSATTLPLAAAASSPFTVSVTIPAGAAEGASDLSTVTFTPDVGTPVTVTAIALVQYASTDEMWQELPDVPMKLEHPAAASLGNHIYVIGGTRQDTESPDIFYVETAVHRYDVTTNLWVSSEDGAVAELPYGRRAEGACGMNGKVYVMGGYGETSGVAQMAWDLFIYDEAADTWDTGHAMLSARVEFPAVCDENNGKVYAIGGIINTTDTTLDNAELSNDMAIYDVATDTWTAGAMMNNYRYDSVAGMPDDETVIVAGNSYDVPGARRTESYSITDNVWTPIDDLTVVRTTAACGVLDPGRFCVVGGFNLTATNGREDTYECYDGSYWVPQKSLLNYPRNNMAWATVGGQMYAIAGDWVYTSGTTSELRITGTFERYPHSAIPDVSPDEAVEPVPDADAADDVPVADVGPDQDAVTDARPDAAQDVAEEEGEEPGEEGCGCEIVG